MSDLEVEERAQLGLKQIEDAIVALLARHDEGLTAGSIAGRLGLAEGRASDKRIELVGAVLDLLLATDRIRWDGDSRVFRDNPDKI